MNLVSYHLKQLRQEGLVFTRRSESDGRDIYYSLDLDALRARFYAAGAALHPGLLAAAPEQMLVSIPDQPLRVLFICTHNSARSQMAEAMLRQMSGGQVEAHSAGSHPGEVHPDALQTMARMRFDMTGQYSKPLSVFENQSFDYVITVCDLAREVCPTFPGDSIYIHWGLADPARVTDDSRRAQAFEETARRLKTRIAYFLAGLPQ